MENLKSGEVNTWKMTSICVTDALSVFYYVASLPLQLAIHTRLPERCGKTSR